MSYAPGMAGVWRVVAAVAVGGEGVMVDAVLLMCGMLLDELANGPGDANAMAWA